MQKIIIYPGKFQPFSPHHYKVYQHLVEKFGSEVLIGTSNKSGDVNHPFDYNEKKEFICAYGIPAKRVILEPNPYKPIILNHYDISDTALVIALGQKDAERIKYTKKDGTPGYYKPYLADDLLQSCDKHGYIYIIPHVSSVYSGNEISGTFTRNFIRNCNEDEWQEYFGWYHPELYKLAKKKVNSDILESILVGNSSETFKEAYIQTDRISFSALKNLEKYLDFIFDRVDIDIDLSKKHFLDRVNDFRNNPLIKLSEIEALFNKFFKKYHGKLKTFSDKDQGVMHDKQTKINIPFVVEWNPKLQKYSLIAKTAMRKMNFGTSDIKLTVERVIKLNKSLGISRSNLPQINDVDDFKDYLESKNIQFKMKRVPLYKIGFTQSEIEDTKVFDMLKKNNFKTTKPTIMSKDYYILDGHHRISAWKAYDKNEEIPALVVNLYIPELINVASNFDGAEFKSIHEQK